MKLSVGISPCPNDTYIFEALAQNKNQLLDFNIDFEYQDIAVLNQKAVAQDLDIVKISYAHYFNIAEDYILLRSGGAMGFGVGPLLLSKKENANPSQEHSVAIPGKSTTANFLLQYAYPNLQNKRVLPFNKIEQALIDEEFDLGLVIHESRFTYQEKGLHKVKDLGEFWEEKEKLPIPLGGIAIKRSLAKDYGKLINDAIIESIEWQSKQNALSEYIKSHAQEMDENVMQQHINLYVNDFSTDIGDAGERAISFMQKMLLPNLTQAIFIEC